MLCVSPQAVVAPAGAAGAGAAGAARRTGPGRGDDHRDDRQPAAQPRRVQDEIRDRPQVRTRACCCSRQRPLCSLPRWLAACCLEDLPLPAASCSRCATAGLTTASHCHPRALVSLLSRRMRPGTFPPPSLIPQADPVRIRTPPLNHVHTVPPPTRSGSTRTMTTRWWDNPLMWRLATHIYTHTLTHTTSRVVLTRLTFDLV